MAAQNSVADIGVRLTVDTSQFEAGVRRASGSLNALRGTTQAGGGGASGGGALPGRGAGIGTTEAGPQNIKAEVSFTEAQVSGALKAATKGLALSIPISITEASISSAKTQIMEGLGTIPVVIAPQFAGKGPQSITNVMGSVLSMQYGISQTQGRSLFKETVQKIGPMPKGMAAGGRARSFEPIVVGERRPEVFVPTTNGRILPSVDAYRREIDGLSMLEKDIYRRQRVIERSLSTIPQARLGRRVDGGRTRPPGYRFRVADSETDYGDPMWVVQAFPRSVKGGTNPRYDERAVGRAYVARGESYKGKGLTGALMSYSTIVDHGHRRRGVAGWMYRSAERYLGEPLSPSDAQLTGGKALWADPDKPFGGPLPDMVPPGQMGMFYPRRSPRRRMAGGITHAMAGSRPMTEGQVAAAYPYRRLRNITERFIQNKAVMSDDARDWYTIARAQAMGDMADFGYQGDPTIGLLAAANLSPGMAWPNNRALFRQLLQGVPPSQMRGSGFVPGFGDVGGGVSRGRGPFTRAHQVLSARSIDEALALSTGPKVNPFGKNLSGLDPNVFTLDARMQQIATNDQMVLRMERGVAKVGVIGAPSAGPLRRNTMKSYESLYQKYGAQLGARNISEFQAILWSSKGRGADLGDDWTRTDSGIAIPRHPGLIVPFRAAGGAVAIDPTDIRKDLVPRIQDTIARLSDEYPMVAGNALKKVQLARRIPRYANYDNQEHTMNLAAEAWAPSYDKPWLSKAGRMRDQGYHAVSTAEGVIAHEFGHAVRNYMASGNVPPELLAELVSFEGLISKDPAEIGSALRIPGFKGVSPYAEYARTFPTMMGGGPFEPWGELFASMHSLKAKPQPEQLTSLMGGLLSNLKGLKRQSGGPTKQYRGFTHKHRTPEGTIKHHHVGGDHQHEHPGGAMGIGGAKWVHRRESEQRAASPSVYPPEIEQYLHPGVDWQTQDWRSASRPTMVPTAHLLRYRNLNREVVSAPGRGPHHLDELTEKIGAEGFLEDFPVKLGYDLSSHSGMLYDGNHRLAAAIRLGLPAIPTVTNVRAGDSSRKFRRLPGAPAGGLDEFGYIPQDLPASWVGFNRLHDPYAYKQYAKTRESVVQQMKREGRPYRMAGGPAHASGGLLARMGTSLPSSLIDEAFEERAARMFGHTDDPRRAGWLTPMGKYLDFNQSGSGEYQRRGMIHDDGPEWLGMPSFRNIPHHAARRLLDPGYNLGQTYNAMMSKGNFRMALFDPSNSTLMGQMATPLTGAQMRRLAADIKDYGIDFSTIDVDELEPFGGVGLLKGIASNPLADPRYASRALQEASQMAGLDTRNIPDATSFWRKNLIGRSQGGHGVKFSLRDMRSGLGRRTRDTLEDLLAEYPLIGTKVNNPDPHYGQPGFPTLGKVGVDWEPSSALAYYMRPGEYSPPGARGYGRHFEPGRIQMSGYYSGQRRRREPFVPYAPPSQRPLYRTIANETYDRQGRMIRLPNRGLDTSNSMFHTLHGRSIEGVATHEFGHAVQRFIDGTFSGASPIGMAYNRLYSDLSGNWDDYLSRQDGAPRRKGAKKSVSIYGAGGGDDPAEAFAELFAESFLGGPGAGWGMKPGLMSDMETIRKQLSSLRSVDDLDGYINDARMRRGALTIGGRIDMDSLRKALGVKHAGVGSRALRATLNADPMGGTFPAIEGVTTPRYGHAVGIANLLGLETEHIAMDPDNLTTKSVRDFLKAFHKQRRAGASFVGTWLDSETKMIDVDPSVVIQRRRDAEMVARAGGEKAGFNLGALTRAIEGRGDWDSLEWYNRNYDKGSDSFLGRKMRATPERLLDIINDSVGYRARGGKARLNRDIALAPLESNMAWRGSAFDPSFNMNRQGPEWWATAMGGFIREHRLVSSYEGDKVYGWAPEEVGPGIAWKRFPGVDRKMARGGPVQDEFGFPLLRQPAGSLTDLLIEKGLIRPDIREDWARRRTITQSTPITDAYRKTKREGGGPVFDDPAYGREGVYPLSVSQLHGWQAEKYKRGLIAPSDVRDLQQSMAAEGVQEPLDIRITPMGQAMVYDGNHRIIAAKDMGREHLPARVRLGSNPYPHIPETFGIKRWAPKRAAGGSSPQGLYIVGEIGEELFVPKTMEAAIPKQVMDQIPKAAGGAQVIGKKRNQLWAAPEDGWIIPNRLLDKVPHLMPRESGGPVRRVPGSFDEEKIGWVDSRGMVHALRDAMGYRRGQIMGREADFETRLLHQGMPTPLNLVEDIAPEVGLTGRGVSGSGVDDLLEMSVDRRASEIVAAISDAGRPYGTSPAPGEGTDLPERLPQGGEQATGAYRPNANPLIASRGASGPLGSRIGSFNQTIAGGLRPEVGPPDYRPMGPFDPARAAQFPSERDMFPVAPRSGVAGREGAYGTPYQPPIQMPAPPPLRSVRPRSAVAGLPSADGAPRPVPPPAGPAHDYVFKAQVVSIDGPAKVNMVAAEPQRTNGGNHFATDEPNRAGAPASAVRLPMDVMETFAQQRESLSFAAQMQAARTPRGLAAVLGTSWLGRSKELARISEQRRSLDVARQATGAVYGEFGEVRGRDLTGRLKGLVEERSFLRVTGARKQEVDAVEAQIAALAGGKKSLTNYVRALEDHNDKVAKGLPGPASGIRNLAAATASVALFGTAMAGFGMVSKAAAPVVTTLVDKMRGWQATSSAITTELGKQTAAAYGNVDAVIAQRAVTAGLSGEMTDYVKSVLGPVATIKAGAAAQSETENLMKAASYTSGRAVPEGLYGGYGGLFGGALLAEALGGGKGYSETLRGTFSTIRTSPGSGTLGPNIGNVEGALKYITSGVGADDPAYARVLDAMTKAATPFESVADSITGVAADRIQDTIDQSLVGQLFGWGEGTRTADRFVEYDQRRGQSFEMRMAGELGYEGGRDINEGLDEGQIQRRDVALADLKAAEDRGYEAIGLIADASWKVTGDQVEIAKGIKAAWDAGDWDGVLRVVEDGIVPTVDGIVATAEQYQKILEQSSAGKTIIPADTWSGLVKRQLEAQLQSIDLTTSREQTLLPYQFYQQTLQQPLMRPETGLFASGSVADIRAMGGGSATGFIREALDSARSSQSVIRTQAAEGREAMLADLRQNVSQQDVDAWIALDAQANDFSSTIKGLTKDMMGLQQVADQANWANQIRIAQRSLGDALGMLGEAGGTRLGYLQREQWLASRASQSLGLASQRISLVSQELSLALQKRQIATALALAQFQAPGETGEERFARQREAIIKAGIQKRQVGLQGQQLGISREQYGLATKQFVIAGQIWSENARRGAIDAARAIDVMQKSRAAAQAAATANVAIGKAGQAMGGTLRQMATIEQKAGQRFQTALGAATSNIANFSGSLIEGDQAIRKVLGMGARSPEDYGLQRSLNSGNAAGGSGGGGSKNNKNAAGFLGTVSRETMMTVGEAGAETVAILRNPRRETLTGGGGGASGPISLTFHVTGSKDPEETAERIARKVERILSRKGELLGLRAPSY